MTWVDRLGAGDAEGGGPAGGMYWVLADGAASDGGGGAPGVGDAVSLGGADGCGAPELGDAGCAGVDAVELGWWSRDVEPRCALLSR